MQAAVQLLFASAPLKGQGKGKEAFPHHAGTKNTMGMIRCFNCMEVFDDQFDVCPHCGYVTDSLPAVAYHLYPRTELNGRFIIGTVIGHGGFGITYNAWDTTLNVHVAVKEFYPNGLVNRIPGTKEVIVLSGDKQEQYKQGLNRFLDEAKNTVAFGAHPNIVNVFSFFEENNTAYIVMEFLNGQSVSAYLKQWNGILRQDEALEITTAVCDALTEIHSHNIIHRDINPGNIFLCDKGVKLIDFGAARMSETEFEKTRSIVITPGYAPPEQYQSKSRQGPWTDVYALAATLYRMLTGKRPLESIDRMVDDQLEMPRALNEEIPEWLERVIMNGMALNSTLRFQTAAELKAAIESQTMQDLPEERIRKRKKKRIILFSAITAGALAVSGAAIAYFASHRPNTFKEGTKLTVEVPENEISLYQSLYDQYFPETYREKLTMEFTAESEHPQVYLKGTHPDIEKADLSHVYKELTVQNYYFLPELSSAGKKDALPVGYYQVMAYISRDYLKEKGIAESLEKEQMLAEEILRDEKLLYVETLEEQIPQVVKGFREGEGGSNDSTVEQFAMRQADILIGTNAQYQQILDVCNEKGNSENTITLNYDIYPLYADGKALGGYGEQWCIAADADKDQTAAAELWLEFLLQDSVQQVMYISGSELLPGIPVSQNAVKEYVKYKGLLAGFLERDASVIRPADSDPASGAA